MDYRFGETVLEKVDHIPYLGSHLSFSSDLQDVIQHCLKCAESAFGIFKRKFFKIMTSEENVCVQGSSDVKSPVCLLDLVNLATSEIP